MSSETTANSHWQAYGDYQSVSQRVAQSIDDAIDAYAQIQSLHQEGARVKSEPAAEARSRILSAALKLIPELEHDKQKHSEILERWQTDGSVASEDDDELGFVKRLNTVQLTRSCPDWLHQFVIDIRTAGWELGYLKAGRSVDEEPDDIEDRDTERLFE